MEGKDALFVVKYTGAIDSIVWRMTADGLLGMDARMLNRGNGGGYKGEFFVKTSIIWDSVFHFRKKK